MSARLVPSINRLQKKLQAVGFKDVQGIWACFEHPAWDADRVLISAMIKPRLWVRYVPDDIRDHEAIVSEMRRFAGNRLVENQSAK